MRNFGVTENPDKTLRLEEKGSVYNEMVSSSGNPIRVLFRTGTRLVYGSQHPLSYNAGGETSGIRTMKPEDIRISSPYNDYALDNTFLVGNNLPIGVVMLTFLFVMFVCIVITFL